MTRRFFASVTRRVLVLATLLGLLATSAYADTVDTIRERGFLICASANSLPGFSQQNDAGLWSGFDVDFCRAVAAAVLGDPNLVEFRALAGEARFADLQTGAVDLLSRGASWSLQRDTAKQVKYVVTSFFDGQAFMVPEDMGVVSAFELNDISICTLDTPSERTTIEAFFFQTQVKFTHVLYEEREDLTVAYNNGLCDAVSAPARWLHGLRKSLEEPTRHRILPERISKEPFGPIIRSGDDVWANVVRWTFYSLVNAEELGITAENIDTMLEVNSRPVRRVLGTEEGFQFGEFLGLENDWVIKVIRAVGNYGEMYERNFGPQMGVPLQRGLNSLWTQGGLIFAPPVI